MRKTVETGGFLIAVLGLAGICREYLGWAPFGVVRRVLPHGQGVLWLNIVLMLVGGLVMAAPDIVRDARR